MQNISHQQMMDYGSNNPNIPTVHVISDSLGDTAADVALAAASQFSWGAVHIERLPKVQDMEQVRAFLDVHQPKVMDNGDLQKMVVFYTIADTEFSAELEAELEKRQVGCLDLLGPAVREIAQLTGEEPSGKSGVIRRTDERYFRRIDAMEYSVNHDDGRNPEGLTEADIVLVGVSRTSKTPLSMYLAFQGYRVANVPLAAGTTPPPELFDVEPHRLYGLISTPEVLSEIRHKRLGDEKTRQVAGSYADPQKIQAELNEARGLMRRLGCIVIRTDNRAVEETAQEIIGYFETAELYRSQHTS